MISLYDALRITKRLESNEEIIYLKYGNDGSRYADEIRTVAEIKEKYDLRNTKVRTIDAYLPNGEYRGMLFTLAQERTKP